MLHAHQCAHALLLDVGEIVLEFIREPKCHDWESRIIVGTSLILGARDDSLFVTFSIFINRACEVIYPDSAMDVADADIPPTGLNCLTQKSCIGQAVLHNFSETIESEVNEVIILCDYLRTWT